MLEITPEFIERDHVWTAKSGATLLGFVAVSISEGQGELEHLWVLPEHMGQGIGRKLMHHAINYYKTHHIGSLRNEADPNAVGFYDKFGAKKIGEIPSKPEPRVLPVLRIDL